MATIFTLKNSMYNIPFFSMSVPKVADKCKKVVSETVQKQPTELMDKLVELKKKHFNALSLKDKLLIKVGLREDITTSMAILDHIGAAPVKLKGENTISINSYGYPELNKIKKLGLKEDEVIKHVSTIRRYADFNDSSLTDLVNIRRVGHNLYLGSSKINNIDGLKYVGRHVYLNENLSKKDFENTYVYGCILN